MIEMTRASGEYWRDVLGAGGFTKIPRWAVSPVTGVAEHECFVSDDLAESLRARAIELGVPLRVVFLAAHAKVLSALSGEREVTTGYVAMDGDRPLPFRLTTEPHSWGSLLLEVHRAESDLMQHKDFPVEDLKREIGLTDASFETVYDAQGGERELAEEVVLQVGISEHGDGLAIRLLYRTESIDAECAARIAGYHHTALALFDADPDAEHRHASLISDEEMQFQVEGLAGPRRDLPDNRFHELFEQRVAAHPDAVAAVCGDRRWTYRDLNVRANKVGHALLEHGLRPEDVVAVVTERNLDWMAAVLAVFKAGGVYLPIEPHFPSDRIENMLSRAECRIVLTKPGIADTLDKALEALPGVHKLIIADTYERDHAGDNPGVSVSPNQAAYIYFTSGSTGEPKGAMCEHAGMLNHLYAKIEDLEIGSGQTVAQTAPQCFDISLWQLVASLLVGGRTLLIDQQTILDVERFVDTIVEGDVAVMQVVPSYLEVVLSYLERSQRELPGLKCVSVTGEAVTMELVRRWFAAKPAIKLANAYGLTETSDDTNHEVMDEAPDGDRVPLGRAVNNVYIYVVDEYLSPVPLGAPGEIVFSGVCVGRGYVNDPERTRLAFMDDPVRDGQRLYRSGDYGRWRADGKLEFLGRRDAQVKIRGFRIEVGEIENRLSRVQGIRQAAVVVAERADGGKQLVGFYSGQRLEDQTLQDRLGKSLPEYMVPSSFHWQENLPLTANGKIDKKTLKTLAAELGAGGHEFEAPRTASERRLAAVWANVLGVSEDQISRQDNFFDRGGTSLSAVKLVVGLDRAVSLKDVTGHPVLADLARLLDNTSERQSGLLQLLSESTASQAGAIVCFPYAGGNAVSFQPMARALHGSGLAVYATELPGHDLAADREPFAPMDEVVEQVADEITRSGLTRVFLWGHSSGAAFALETARKLQERRANVERVFLAAQLPGEAVHRRAAVTELSGQTDSEIAARLGADREDPEFSRLDTQRAEHVGAAYRHDCVSAHEYFAGALENPPAVKLSSPVTVVVAADDPYTADYARRYSDWQHLAERVDLHEIADGGHNFLRTRPTEAVQPILRATAHSPSSSPRKKRGDQDGIPGVTP